MKPTQLFLLVLLILGLPVKVLSSTDLHNDITLIKGAFRAFVEPFYCSAVGLDKGIVYIDEILSIVDENEFIRTFEGQSEALKAAFTLGSTVGRNLIILPLILIANKVFPRQFQKLEANPVMQLITPLFTLSYIFVSAGDMLHAILILIKQCFTQGYTTTDEAFAALGNGLVKVLNGFAYTSTRYCIHPSIKLLTAITHVLSTAFQALTPQTYELTLKEYMLFFIGYFLAQSYVACTILTGLQKYEKSVSTIYLTLASIGVYFHTSKITAKIIENIVGNNLKADAVTE